MNRLRILLVITTLTIVSSVAVASPPSHWKPYSYGKAVYEAQGRRDREPKIVYKGVAMRPRNRRPHCGTDLRSPIPLSHERGILWVFKKAGQ